MTPNAMNDQSDGRLLIYGAGGFAREVAWLAENTLPPRRIDAFLDDHCADRGIVNGIPVLSLADGVASHPGAMVVVAVGDPALRESLARRATAAGLVPTTLIHSRVERSRFVEIKAGAVICAGTILTTNISLGQHVQINLDCTVGHDVTLDDFATLAPGVHVSGWVRVGRGAYLGTGASIINGTPEDPVIIGDWAVVGAGAVVTRSVPAGTTVVGVPAKARTMS